MVSPAVTESRAVASDSRGQEEGPSGTPESTPATRVSRQRMAYLKGRLKAAGLAQARRNLRASIHESLAGFEGYMARLDSKNGGADVSPKDSSAVPTTPATSGQVEAEGLQVVTSTGETVAAGAGHDSPAAAMARMMTPLANAHSNCIGGASAVTPVRRGTPHDMSKADVAPGASAELFRSLRSAAARLAAIARELEQVEQQHMTGRPSSSACTTVTVGEQRSKAQM